LIRLSDEKERGRAHGAPATPPDVLYIFRRHWRALRVFLDEGALTALEDPSALRSRRAPGFVPYHFHIRVEDAASRLRVVAGLRQEMTEPDALRLVEALEGRGWELRFTDEARHYRQLIRKPDSFVFVCYTLLCWAALNLLGNVLPLPFPFQAPAAFLLGAAGAWAHRARRASNRKRRVSRRQEEVEKARYSDPQFARQATSLWRGGAGAGLPRQVSAVGSDAATAGGETG
jgi:hypothetical protein